MLVAGFVGLAFLTNCMTTRFLMASVTAAARLTFFFSAKIKCIAER